MDSKVEDKIVRQIERNLSNNINENLFLSGKIYEKDNQPYKKSVSEEPDRIANSVDLHQEGQVASIEYTNQSPTLSRAEYIRQARESCLRQFSAMQNSAETYNNLYQDADPQSFELINPKKTKAMKILHNNSYEEDTYKEENTPQEIASFRFLIIRTACAIVLFLSIFIIDKFDVKIGSFSSEVIKEFVTGNDSLQELEDVLVTKLK